MEIVYRALTLFFFVFLLTRAMGKKELAALSAFELILLVVMGDLIQQGVTQEDQSVTGAMLAIGTIALLIITLSWVQHRWRGSRWVLEGLPVVVIRDGRPLDETMHIERLSLDELKDAARQQGIGDLAEVKVGILEPDGKFSFIKADGGSDDQPPDQDSPFKG
jgi:uncharacterized membrane protein YcaP (DUF421 family)